MSLHSSARKSSFLHQEPSWWKEPRWDDDILTIPFVARRHPRIAPTDGILDGDLNDLGINVEWASHIIGVLEVLNQRDAWYGTDEEQHAALNEIMALIELFSTVAD